MNPKVSAVIPTYNRANKVVKTIESALAQNFTGLEVIVIDDGSSDGTDRVLAEAFGDRIRYYYQKNQGASVARNRGIEEARGEWVAFLDSDDRWVEGKLENQLKALELYGPQCGACYTDVSFFDHPEERTMFQLAEDNYRHLGPHGVNHEVLRLLVRPGGGGMVVCLSSLMVRTDVLRKTGGFDPKILFSQDSELMFRLGMATGFCYVNQPFVLFDRSPKELRHVGVSADWNKMDFFLQDSQTRLEGLLQLSDQLPKSVQKVIVEQLGTVHSGWTNWYLHVGEHAKARESISKALRINPNFNVAAKWLLTWLSPQLALRSVERYQNTKDSSAFI
jgi:glycosyltransferase involved in cell wall biosynthesis